MFVFLMALLIAFFSLVADACAVESGLGGKSTRGALQDLSGNQIAVPLSRIAPVPAESIGRAKAIPASSPAQPPGATAVRDSSRKDSATRPTSPIPSKDRRSMLVPKQASLQANPSEATDQRQGQRDGPLIERISAPDPQIRGRQFRPESESQGPLLCRLRIQQGYVGGKHHRTPSHCKHHEAPYRDDRYRRDEARRSSRSSR